jgi:hypothetical protein
LNKLLEKEIIEEIETLANKSQSDRQKHIVSEIQTMSPNPASNRLSVFASINWVSSKICANA